MHKEFEINCMERLSPLRNGNQSSNMHFFYYIKIMYCVKCKRKTKTDKITYIRSKNNKPLMKGQCLTCKKTKTQFISVETAKKDGFVFTLPAALAGISTLGSLAGSAAGIATAVNKKKIDDKMVAETIRHNKAMEKSGKGVFLRKGKGLHLKPYKK